MVYVDDAILTGPSKEELEQAYDELDSEFSISYEGDLSDYLGVHIERTENGGIKLTQSKLIETIIKDMNLLERTKPRRTPAKSSLILNSGADKKDHLANWKYRSIIGKLNFLEKSTRPDIGYAVHNCARFMENPKENHTEAIMDIVRYLKGTKDKGIELNPNDSSFECYVDADFAGLWDSESAEDDRTTARSRTGYIIKYGGCPIVWSSKLQTEIALSTTAAEYVALSTAIREVLPLMEMLEEIVKLGVMPTAPTPIIRCKVFEDNAGALKIAKAPKMRPRTKYLNTKYHHFRDQVESGRIRLEPISTEHQQADILTKALSEDLFIRFRTEILGWSD